MQPQSLMLQLHSHHMHVTQAVSAHWQLWHEAGSFDSSLNIVFSTHTECAPGEYCISVLASIALSCALPTNKYCCVLSVVT